MHVGIQQEIAAIEKERPAIGEVIQEESVGVHRLVTEERPPVVSEWGHFSLLLVDQVPRVLFFSAWGALCRVWDEATSKNEYKMHYNS